MVSLHEKLQVEAKEMPGEPISDRKAETLPVDIAQIFSMKVEDHFSTGSVGSAVVDEGSPQLVVDSVDSYFPADNNYGGCMAPVERVQSEEDDGSDDGRSYFSDVFVATETEHQNNEEGEALGWWGNMLHNGPVLF